MTNESIDTLRQQVRQDPDSAAGYIKLAQAYAEQRKSLHAMLNYDIALQLNPHNEPALKAFSDIAFELGNYDSISLRPGSDDVLAESFNTLASLHRRAGFADIALPLYEKVVALLPTSAPAYVNLGNACREMGDAKSAEEAFKMAVSLAPNFAGAHYHLSLVKTYEPKERLISQMTDRYRATETSDGDRILFGFALAKALDDTGKTDQSFRTLNESNRICKKQSGYQAENDAELFREIKTKFSLPPTAYRQSEHAPIFVVGLPRSGTSLVEQILSSHSAVTPMGELGVIGNLARNALSDQSESWQDQIPSVPAIYNEQMRQRQVATRFGTDKMPLNFRWIGFIQAAIPGAKIVHVHRDPIATCWSLFKHHFSVAGHEYSNSLEDLAAFYDLYFDLMNHWYDLYPTRIYSLDYDTLVSAQKSETKRLLDYCGLSFEQACMDFHQSKHTTNTASAMQVKQEMYAGSSDAWRPYERQLQPLIEAIGEKKMGGGGSRPPIMARFLATNSLGHKLLQKLRNHFIR